MGDLKGQYVWITGGAKRLGKAMALACAERGANLIIHYRSSEDEARAVVEEIKAKGVDALMVQGDLRSVDDIQRMIRTIESTTGRLDVFINSASNFIRTPLDEIDEEAWDLSLDVNLKGPAFCAIEAAKLMKKMAAVALLILPIPQRHARTLTFYRT